ncbi:MAG: pantoate--beta-alanine ligase, partial [Proteobacteria bacterium]|nr:pantoate--beta-alanine ligase [Pseudomonadota bacterium]
QCYMIRRMVEDLCIPTKVIGCPTHRETDGLAMSSRNTRLTQEERRLAPELYRAMQAVDNAYIAGETNQASLLDIYANHLRQFPAFRLEYAEFRQCKDLKALGESIDTEAVLIVAAYLGSVRLIDNLELSVS